MSEFTTNSTIKGLIQKAQSIKQSEQRFSDIVDENGYQYVDLVQEGGGVLGIALVGYTYILETAGIRFLSLAGTSAGAINTILMAGVDNIASKKSEKLIDILADQNLFDFVDGDPKSKKFIQKILNDHRIGLLPKLFSGWRIYKVLKKKLGLNPGTTFEKWVADILKGNNIETIGDLQHYRSKLPKGLKSLSNEKDISGLEAKIAIISSDITTHTKSEFPRMAKLYWKDHEKVPISRIVKASMSIPYFFEPLAVHNLPNKGKKNVTSWVKEASFTGEIPNSVKFVDGGMLSNFPINVFHRKNGGVPRMPTFGVRLSVYRENFSKTDSLLSMSGAMVKTMRQIHDYDFLLKNPDYKNLICRIDADEEFNWLDFGMSRDTQIKLFNLGAKKAVEFLHGFDWKAYKGIRKELSNAIELSQ